MGTSKIFSIELKFCDNIWLVWGQLLQSNAKTNSKVFGFTPPQNNTLLNNPAEAAVSDILDCWINYT